MARFSDTEHRVKETSVANKELVVPSRYYVGFDWLSEQDATLIYFDKEHKVLGGIPFSISVEEGFKFRSFKVKESGVVFTLYAAYIGS